MILSGRDLKYYIEQGYLKIDPVDDSQFQQNGIDLVLKDVDAGAVDGEKWFRRGFFYLGVTREVVELPNDLMAFVQLRSSWARRGLMLPPTVVDAGFKGDLTLEIASFDSMKAPIGERFAHLIFAKTTSPCEPYRGKYQDQRGITEAKEDV